MMNINNKIHIKNSDGTNFYDIYMKDISVNNNVMGDYFATGSFVYKDNSLCDKFHIGLYIEYRKDRLYLAEQPSLSHNNKDSNGLVTYDVKFAHARDGLKNIPMTDEPLRSGNEQYYRNGSRNVVFFGNLTEMVDRINAALAHNAPSSTPSTQWKIALQSGFVDNSESKHIVLDDTYITDALKTMYDTFHVPYMFIGYTIYVGMPINELGHIFEFGQGVGLKNDDRISKKNKVITRISGHGSTDNVPYGYPIIRDSKGIVIRHPYTRSHIMPSVWVEGVKRKVLQGSTERLVDWYDAIGGEYPNQINAEMPQFDIVNFDSIKPTIKGATYGGQAIDQIAGVPSTNDYDDKFDVETSEYKKPTFEIILHPLGFDLYAQMAVTGAMSLSITSGDCRGAKFPLAIDEDALRLAFYDKDNNFIILPDTDPLRKKFPDSTSKSITIKLFKEDETYGRLYPNPYQKPNIGDKFVILDIEMPQLYIDEAQVRLDNALKKHMKDNNFHKYEYPLIFDEYFLHDNLPILEQIGTNALIPFKYNDKILKLPIQSIVTAEGNTPLPAYNITLTDDISVNFNSVGKVEDGLEDLEKDVIQDEIKGQRQAANFYQGLKKVVNGVFDADGSNRIKLVEALVLKANMSLIGQMSSNFSLQNTKVKFVDLNRVDFISGSIFHYEVSRAKDYDYTQAVWNIRQETIATLEVDSDYYIYIQANRTNNDAIWHISKDAFIYDQDPNVFYFLWGQSIIVDGQRHPFNTYGLTATLGGFIVTQQLKSPNFILDDNQFTGMLIDLIRAKIYMGDGAEIIAKTIKFRQPDGTDIDAMDSITNIKNEVSEANKKIAEEEQSRIDAIAGVNKELVDIQKQVDGVVENWFYPYEPSSTTFPASTWISVTEKQNHIGDTFTSISQFPATDAGKSWRWVEIDGVFGWFPISDSDSVKALQEASKAQSTADGKSTTYIVKPTKYKIGDLWVLRYEDLWSAYKTGDVLTSSYSRDSFRASDWSKKIRYTDDTVAHESWTAAIAAESKATTALKSISDITLDSKFSPNEKHVILKECQIIESEKPSIDNQALLYLVDVTKYNYAYTVLIEYITPLLANISVTSDIDGDVFRVAFTNYYKEKQKVLDLIASKNATTLSDKDNIAKGLGYVDYADMIEKIGENQDNTIIDGGFLRTNLIKANEIVAENIRTALSGDRVEIIGYRKRIQAFDADNKECVTISGERLTNFNLPTASVDFINIKEISGEQRVVKSSATTGEQVWLLTISERYNGDLFSYTGREIINIPAFKAQFKIDHIISIPNLVSRFLLTLRFEVIVRSSNGVSEMSLYRKDMEYTEIFNEIINIYIPAKTINLTKLGEYYIVTYVSVISSAVLNTEYETIDSRLTYKADTYNLKIDTLKDPSSSLYANGLLSHWSENKYFGVLQLPTDDFVRAIDTRHGFKLNNKGGFLISNRTNVANTWNMPMNCVIMANISKSGTVYGLRSSSPDEITITARLVAGTTFKLLFKDKYGYPSKYFTYSEDYFVVVFSSDNITGAWGSIDGFKTANECNISTLSRLTPNAPVDMVVYIIDKRYWS